jgi:hypothetical protein
MGEYICNTNFSGSEPFSANIHLLSINNLHNHYFSCVVSAYLYIQNVCQDWTLHMLYLKIPCTIFIQKNKHGDFVSLHLFLQSVLQVF